ncbi:MAG: DUF835 domain-containing protein [Halobacteria archaeon]
MTLPYVAASALNLLISIALGLYVYRRNPRAVMNRLFVLILFGEAFWAATILASRIPLQDPGMQYLYKITGFTPIFLVALVLHFVMAFVRHPFLERPGRWALLYFPGLAFTVLFLYDLDLYATGVRFYDTGYHLEFGPLIGPYVATMAGFAVGSLVVAGRAWLRATAPETRRQRRLLFLGLLVLTLFIGSIQTVRMVYDRPLPVTQNDAVLAMCALWAYGVFRRGFLVMPVEEVRSHDGPRYAPPRGSSFLVREERPDLAYRVFADLVTHGAQGICFTRTPPDRFRSAHGLERTPVVWVGEQSPSPDIPVASDSDEIAYLTAKFLAACTDGVVLFDCFEYLVQEMEFSKALKLFYHLRELVGRHDARLLLSVNPAALPARGLSLLEKELEPFVEGSPGLGREGRPAPHSAGRPA